MTWVALLVALCATAQAKEVAKPWQAKPTFAVLQIQRGKVLTFRAVLSGKIAAEREQVAQEDEKALAAWERKSQGKTNPEPKPLKAQVTVRRDGFLLRQDAETLAEELKTEAKATYVVVQVMTYTDEVESHLEVLREDKVNQRRRVLAEDFKAKREKRSRLKLNVICPRACMGEPFPNETGTYKRNRMWLFPEVHTLQDKLGSKAEAEKAKAHLERKLGLGKTTDPDDDLPKGKPK